VREDPFYLWSMKVTVWVIHWSHLPCMHHSPCVQLLGVAKMSGQPNDLSKLSKLHGEPPTIGHPHKEPIFLVKEESRVELGDDLLIKVVAELQKIGDTMEITSFNNFVERGIFLPSHVAKVHPLHGNNKLGLSVEHCVISILVKESLEALIGAPFLGLGVASFLMHLSYPCDVNLVVVHHFPVGEDLSEPHLQTFKFWRSGWRGTMRWGVLGRGILTETARPWPLGELLGLRGWSLA
jgi:hypothetical protein